MAYSAQTFSAFETPTTAKWNLLWSNDASFADGTSVTGAWSTWTPTVANMTNGSASIVAKYNQIGKTVFYYYEWTFGAGSAVSTNPSITLPVAPKSGTYSSDASGGSVMGNVSFYDVSATRFYPGGMARLSGASTISFMVATASGTFVDTANAVASTQPFTFATGDKIFVSGIYEAN